MIYLKTISAKTVSAFTLLETLVAISVMLMALLGPFSIASQSLRSAFYARDQVTAFYLAQEGVEYVRAVRDQNYLAGADWMTGLSSCNGVGVLCTVDFKLFSSTVCPSGVCPLLYIDSAGLYTQQSSATVSKFTRTMSIADVPGTPDQKIISVTVSWKSVGIVRSFTVKERIFNWL